MFLLCLDLASAIEAEKRILDRAVRQEKEAEREFREAERLLKELIDYKKNLEQKISDKSSYLEKLRLEKKRLVLDIRDVSFRKSLRIRRLYLLLKLPVNTAPYLADGLARLIDMDAKVIKRLKERVGELGQSIKQTLHSRKELQKELKDLKREIERRKKLLDALRRIWNEKIKERKYRQKRLNYLLRLSKLKEFYKFEGFVKGKVPCPLIPCEVVRSFGRFRYPGVRIRLISKGVDLKPFSNTVVCAVAPGEVIFSKYVGGFGKMVVVKHQGNVYTLYGNLRRSYVEKGEKVKAGQAIGEISIRHVLHFEIRFSERPVDPLSFIRKELVFRGR